MSNLVCHNVHCGVCIYDKPDVISPCRGPSQGSVHVLWPFVCHVEQTGCQSVFEYSELPHPSPLATRGGLESLQFSLIVLLLLVCFPAKIRSLSSLHDVDLGGSRVLRLFFVTWCRNIDNLLTPVQISTCLVSSSLGISGCRGHPQDRKMGDGLHFHSTPHKMS